jgi:hypothetical protein
MNQNTQLGSRQPVLQRCLPCVASQLRHTHIYEPQRQLLAAQNLAWGHTAPMESSFGTLKTESLHHYRFATREEARRVVFNILSVLQSNLTSRQDRQLVAR